jgi:hypothetical protein
MAVVNIQRIYCQPNHDSLGLLVAWPRACLFLYSYYPARFFSSSAWDICQARGEFDPAAEDKQRIGQSIRENTANLFRLVQATRIAVLVIGGFTGVAVRRGTL